MLTIVYMTSLMRFVHGTARSAARHARATHTRPLINRPCACCIVISPPGWVRSNCDGRVVCLHGRVSQKHNVLTPSRDDSAVLVIWLYCVLNGSVALFCTCIVVLFLLLPLDIVSPMILLPPPKKEVMFSVRSVCLSVCLSVRRITCKLVNGF